MANGQGMAYPATAVTHPWSGFGIDALPPVRMDRRTGSDRRPLRGGCRPEPAGRWPPAAGSGPGRDPRFRGGGSPRAASAEWSPAVSGRGGSRRSLRVRRTIRPERLRLRGGEGGAEACRDTSRCGVISPPPWKPAPSRIRTTAHRLSCCRTGFSRLGTTQGQNRAADLVGGGLVSLQSDGKHSLPASLASQRSPVRALSNQRSRSDSFPLATATTCNAAPR